MRNWSPSLGAGLQARLTVSVLAELEAMKRTCPRASLLFVRAGKRHSWTCDPARMMEWENRLAAVVRKIRGGDFDARHEGTCRCAHGWTCGCETDGGKDLELELETAEDIDPPRRTRSEHEVALYVLRK